jgi:quercetin dioxygenase-like cupin family protein
MGFEIRRIVTGHDADGSAIVHSDSQLSAQQVPNDTAWFNKIWSTECWPSDNSDERDGAEQDSTLSNANGSVLRIVEMAPGHRSPMHRTPSLDYGIVLSGEIELELDDGRSVLLHSGDVVVQRGTIHAWRNPGAMPARMAFVLLSAAPLPGT